MSKADRQKWDARYGAGEHLPRRDPSAFLEECLPLLQPGRALVLACGTGRNALRLAEAGFKVDAWDVSPVGIDMARTEARLRDLEIGFEVVDLDDAELPRSTYDVITMFRFLNRALWPRMIDALAPGGWVVVETHLATPLPATGPPPGPWRLGPNELVDAFRSLRIIRYEEVAEPAEDEDGRSRVLARLLATNGEPPW